MALVLTGVVTLAGLESPISRQIEFGLRDSVQRVTVRDRPAPEVALVDIDEASIRAVGPWPWPRAVLADLVDAIRRQYPQALVVLDIVLPDPRDAVGDARIKSLLDQRAIVLAQVFDYALRQEPVISGEPQGAVITRPSASISATGVIANHALLKPAANNPCVGNIGFIPDEDGKLRRLPAYTEWQAQHYPSLALASVTCANPNANRTLPNFGLGYHVLNFSHSLQSWQVMTAESVLFTPSTPTGQPPSKSPAPKFIVIGSSALGLSDRVATPIAPNISGMYVHAQAITELHSYTNAATPPGNLSNGVTAMGFIWVAGIGLLLLRERTARYTMLLTLSAALLWFVFMVFSLNFAPDAMVSGPLVGLIALAVGALGLTWREQRERLTDTRNTLERYVAPEVLAAMGSRIDRTSLVPIERELVVLVVDMANYTRTIREHDLSTSSALTKTYLDQLTQAVLGQHGTLDRYTGDGLIAFWGAPLEQTDGEDRAVAAALSMIESIEAQNQLQASNPDLAISIRIGIASGMAVVGDFGTPSRANYTAVGTCINLASRLEQLAKTEHQTVLMTKAVATKLKRFSSRYVGRFDVRGVGETEVYTPVR